MQLFFPHLPPTRFKGKCAFFPRFPEANIHFPFYVIQKLHRAGKKAKKGAKKRCVGGGENIWTAETRNVSELFCMLLQFRDIKPAKKLPRSSEKGKGRGFATIFADMGKKRSFAFLPNSTPGCMHWNLKWKKKLYFSVFPNCIFQKKT